LRSKFAHNNLNVIRLDRSLAFYREALGLREVRRREHPRFVAVFLGDDRTPHELQLTWLRDRTEPYDLGDNKIHTAFTVDDFESAHKLHESMGCICFENPGLGVYFISDPDGYWLEVIPEKK